jgi:hypothetical protein
MPSRWSQRIVVNQETGCWDWTGATVRGYAYVTYQRKNMLLHRAIYTMRHGQIPTGLQAHHECERRICVNPSHLALVTQKEHVHAHDLRGTMAVAERRRNQTHCKYGHEYTPENTGYRADGSRRCRACDRDQTRVYRARKA